MEGSGAAWPFTGSRALEYHRATECTVFGPSRVGVDPDQIREIGRIFPRVRRENRCLHLNLDEVVCDRQVAIIMG